MTASSSLTPDQVYRSETEYVWNVLLRLGVARSDLEDLCHDVFVAAFRRMGSFDPGRPIRPWLFGIAFKLVSRHRRRLAHHAPLEAAGEGLASPEPGPHAQLDARQASEQVLRALSGLNLDQRAVFVLHELEEQPIPEVAATLGVSLNTAYSRLRLARAGFKQAIQLASRGET